MTNLEMLHEEIEKGFEALDTLKKGSEEYEAIVEAQVKLLGRAIEIDRLNIEHEEKLKEQDLKEKEQELKEKELEIEKKDRKWKHGIAIGSAAAGLVTTFFWCREYLIFEETGAVSTQGGRKMLDRAINYFFKK